MKSKNIFNQVPFQSLYMFNLFTQKKAFFNKCIEEIVIWILVIFWIPQGWKSWHCSSLAIFFVKSWDQ
jgi:hypothetical protein